MKEWIYGRNPVYETLRSGRREVYKLLLGDQVGEKGYIPLVTKLARSKKVEIESVPRRFLDEKATQLSIQNHQSVMLQVGEFKYADLWEIMDLAVKRNEFPFILVLDELQDPQNLGTLLRTAEIVGVHGVIIPSHRAASVTPAVVNASSGAAEHLLIAQGNLAQMLRELKEQNVWVIGLEGGEGSQLLQNVRLDGSIALVVGNEGQGIRRLVGEECDILMRLPMKGKIESLNAATAGSVALYFVWQARSYV
ncbi:MAG: 23S rRNA (guanosine(2251)-2'-O)-methyltransferase RlmB [Anaerolineales bacterium]|nr:23S rRNA (guanosine(2251)-2'-O)-methyltransferase RlmB [Anaerolineales bacterium]